MPQILCSTGAIITRNNNRNYELIREYAPLLHCDGFEFMMYNAWYEDWKNMAEALANMPVAFPILHVEKNVGKLISQNESGDIEQAYQLFDINCQIAKRIGAEKLVLHLWSGAEVVPAHRCNDSV